MGLELPPELREALSWVGLKWPEADETALIRSGEYWGTFAEEAAGHAEAAAPSVAAMLGENSAESLDAFGRYWEKVAGQDGYVTDCGIVAGAVSVAFYSAGGLVLTLKLAVIAQLIAYAVILAAAIATAIATLGASLAAAAEIATVVNRTITTFVTGTITAIQQLGVPLSQLAADHLGKQVTRLSGRPIHASPIGTDDFEARPHLSKDTTEEVLETPKGERPDPATYLDQAEIDAHLQPFRDSGAVRITQRATIDRYGTIGPADGTYVIPADEFNGLVQRSGGDLSKVETALGLDPGSLTDGSSVAAYIAPEDLRNLRIPSGNEKGANEQWIPGGYTSGGVPEATVDTPADLPYEELDLG